jgi:cytochrome P450
MFRFLGSDMDFRGRHFQFIPFGVRRRICPGMQFGLAAIELALANLVRLFDWELQDDVAPRELDMSDTPGLTTPRRVGLRLIARLYQWEKHE